jgi:hypothetical protein
MSDDPIRMMALGVLSRELTALESLCSHLATFPAWDLRRDTPRLSAHSDALTDVVNKAKALLESISVLRQQGRAEIEREAAIAETGKAATAE